MLLCSYLEKNYSSEVRDSNNVDRGENIYWQFFRHKKVSFVYLWAFQFPWDVRHHIDCISAANTNAQTAESATVNGVTVSADKEDAWISVVLQNDLMNYTGARLPETNAKFRTRRRQKVIYLKQKKRS